MTRLNTNTKYVNKIEYAYVFYKIQIFVEYDWNGAG